MPYFIEQGNPDCNGWAVVKEGGEVIGCHESKGDAIDHMVAISMAEDIAPGGEKDSRQVSLDLPEYIKSAAARGLELRADGFGGDGLTDGTIREARAMAAGDITEDKVVRANAWGARHAVDLQASQNSDSNDDAWPGAGAVAHYLWGIDPLNPEPARDWFARKVEQMKNERSMRLAGGPGAIICDIDDTLLANGTRPIRSVIDYVNAEDGKLFIVSGRTVSQEDETRAALDDAGVRSYTLRLKADDSVDTADFKRAEARKILEEYDVSEAIDNDAEMRRVYASLGIEAVNPSDIPDRPEEEMNSKEFRFEAPKDNLTRQVNFRAVADTDGRTLEGYAAVFNEWTTIDSWEGTFQERIAPGAFKKTLSERMPVLQFDHGTHPLIGSIPLGVFTALREDENGLFVRGRLSDNWLVEPIRDAIRDGAITGMSFRFRVIKDSWKKGAGNVPERTIQEIALYEAGPVVFPAYEQTSVSVRSREVLTALNDEGVRHELALLLATGTGADALAADTVDAPNDVHATRTKSQRRAITALHNL